jgi:ketosteroid isomerase-like protein
MNAPVDRQRLLSAHHGDARVARVIHWFEHLKAADVPRLGELYTEDTRFKDPFNEVQGLPAVQRIFAHMFETLEAPRFVIVDALAGTDRCALTWDFHLRLRGPGGQALRIHGASWLRFAPDTRIAVHRDYWDAAEELYEQLPGLGVLMRWLRRRAAA